MILAHAAAWNDEVDVWMVHGGIAAPSVQDTEEALRFLAELESNHTEGEPQRIAEMPQFIFQSSLAPVIDQFLSRIGQYTAAPEPQTLYELDLASRTLAYESSHLAASRIGDRSAYASDIAFALDAYDRLRAVLQHVHLDTTDTHHAESIVSNAQVLQQVLHSLDHEHGQDNVVRVHT